MPTCPTYKLGDVAEIILGQSPESKSYNTKGEGLPFFQGKSEFSDWFPVPNKWCTEPKKIAEPLDILLSVRAPVGPTNVAKEKCCIGRGLAAIRYPECYKYVLYYLRSVSKHLESKATGTTFSSISGDVIRNLPIPLPPLPTQHQIVSRIESLFAELDKAEEHLRTAQQQLKIYKQAVLNHWLNNEDGKWEIVKLGEVIEVKDGTHDTPKYVQSGIPFVTQKNITESGISFSNVQYITEQDHLKFHERSNVAQNDILIAMIGANRGNATIVNTDIIFSIKNVGLLKHTPNVFNNKFLLFYLRSQESINYIKKQSKGGAQEFIGLKELRNFPVSLPPLSEQQRIVEEIETRLSQAEAAEARIAESLQKTETLRQSILKKAFSGELV